MTGKEGLRNVRPAHSDTSGIVPSKIIKSAIYTRKSSEEGLELDFNSLDAQREACESYIKSQKHEGWILVEKEYSDGGISGGTLNRPAMQELLQDIKDGLVDMIVVYKIDRLTRSLHDFSKLVEVFDEHNTSFVSITQQFNTSTSMGRLTLNMLLSFAQFEREVTGERIRDKKLATAKKGLWGNGVCSYAYKLVDKKLVPDESEVPNLRRIFELYLELESVQKLRYKLIELGIQTKTGLCFTTGNLYELLKRKVYIGKVVHKNVAYDGIHEPILELDIFNKVQELLKENNKSNKQKVGAKELSLLSGKIYDDNDNIMSPSHANKNNKRYRYYVSQAIMSKQKEKQGTLPQIPAHEIEQASLYFVKDHLQNSLKLENYNIEQYQIYQSNLKNHLQNWSLQNRETHYLIRQILVKLIISNDHIQYYFNPKAINEILNLIVTKQDLSNYKTEKIELRDCQIFEQSCQLKRVNQGKTLIIGNTQTNKNPSLIEVIKKSWEWNNRILQGETSADIQRNPNRDPLRADTSDTVFSKTYVNDILAMRFLSLEIQLKILKGEQPPEWTVHKLRKCKTLDWKDQEKMLRS